MRKQNALRFLAVTMTVLALFVVGAQNTFAQIKMVVYLENPETHLGESHLSERLMERLSMINGLEVEAIPMETRSTLTSSTGYTDLDAVMSTAARMGARYVMLFSNVAIDVDVEKGLSIPLALNRYSVVGNVSGIVRILDVSKGRTLYDDDFEVDKKGRTQWQVFENNPHTAELHIPASEKPQFLESLEWNAADKLSDLALKKMKLR